MLKLRSFICHFFFQTNVYVTIEHFYFYVCLQVCLLINSQEEKEEIICDLNMGKRATFLNQDCIMTGVNLSPFFYYSILLL